MPTVTRGRSAAPRFLLALSVGLLAALLVWTPVLASISWGAVHKASTDKAFGNGNSLGRTVTGAGTAYLHQVFGRDVIGGKEVSASGPYMGVYYKRGNGSGSSWGAAKRLNASTQHGFDGVIATSGKYVYVAWRTVDHYGGIADPSDKRELRFIRNTRHGASTAWSARKTFLGADRIDRPSISATGSRVYIAYTDKVGGEIRLQRSTDHGATFSLLTAVGATTRGDSNGYFGLPVVAASGSTVAVVWNNGTSHWIKVSTNGGDTWTVDQEFESDSVTGLSAAHRSGRLAFVWTGDAEHTIYARLWNGSSLDVRRTVVALSGSTSYKSARYPAIGLAGSTTVGVAYTACTAVCLGESVRWTQSSSNGATWTSSKTVGSYAASSTRRFNEFPSVVFASTTNRIVSWNANGPASDTPYRVLVRRGTGKP